jgi:hypothetical protein
VYRAGSAALRPCLIHVACTTCKTHQEALRSSKQSPNPSHTINEKKKKPHPSNLVQKTSLHKDESHASHGAGRKRRATHLLFQGHGGLQQHVRLWQRLLWGVSASLQVCIITHGVGEAPVRHCAPPPQTAPPQFSQQQETTTLLEVSQPRPQNPNPTSIASWPHRQQNACCRMSMATEK